MHYGKTQLLTDTFQYPKRGAKNKNQKSATRANHSRKPKAPKDPKPKRTPLTPEARKEQQRTRFKEKLQEAKALGLCRRYHDPPVEAIAGQTRCHDCAEKHRLQRREYDKRRHAAAKPSEKKLPQEPVVPASSNATAPQLDQQDEHRKAEPVRIASTPTDRREYERRRRQHPERQEFQRQSQKRVREKRKASGLCKDCRQPAISGQTRCQACAEKRRAKDKEARARKKAETQRDNRDR